METRRKNENSLAEAIAEWEQSSINLRAAMNELFTTLEQKHLELNKKSR